jgi:hypothetical protein
MSANARVVTVDTDFTWDGGEQHLSRGQVMDVAPGSALEAAIGADRLASLYRAPPVTVAAAPPAPAPAPAARKTRSTTRTEGGGDGE